MNSEAPDIVFISSLVDYGIHTHIEAVRYIFIWKIFFCINGTNCKLAFEKFKLRTIYLCLFLVCSRK